MAHKNNSSSFSIKASPGFMYSDFSIDQEEFVIFRGLPSFCSGHVCKQCGYKIDPVNVVITNEKPLKEQFDEVDKYIKDNYNVEYDKEKEKYIYCCKMCNTPVYGKPELNVNTGTIIGSDSFIVDQSVHWDVTAKASDYTYHKDQSVAQKPKNKPNVGSPF